MGYSDTSNSPNATFYRRNLPHWQPGTADIFLTWRLYGSLPFCTARNGCATESPGRKFRRVDSFLDQSKFGPRWLSDPRIARCVVDALQKGATDLCYFALHAFVVMPNHVHLLLTPHVPLRRITNGLKGITARHANFLLHRAGCHFWQDESYDHWLRSFEEFAHISAYIEFNPVSAGLVAKPEDWPWSSVHLRPRFPATRIQNSSVL